MVEMFLLSIQHPAPNNHNVVEFACAITLRIHTVHIVWTQRSEVYIENILMSLKKQQFRSLKILRMLQRGIFKYDKLSNGYEDKKKYLNA